jgi:DNA-directed RNA polymerase subunit RPC12/RpoP
MTKTSTKCPKCQKLLKNGDLIECPFCGLIFKKYKQKRARNFSNAIDRINNTGLDTALPILEDFLDQYPETKNYINTLTKAISNIREALYEKNFVEARPLLENLRKKVKGLDGILSREIDKISDIEKIKVRFERAYTTLKEDRFLEARLVFKQIVADYSEHPALEAYQEKINECQATIDEHIGPENESDNEKNNDDNDVVKCPKCGSRAVVTLKQGYDAGGACCGTILLGPLGLLCGALESNKLQNVCQKCGNKWFI